MRIEVINGSKSFKDNHLYTDLNVSFPDKTITALTGPSGCGKSTLLNIMSGYENLDSGQVVFYSDSVGQESYQISSGDKLIAWIPQISAILPYRTALDNVMIGALAVGVEEQTARQLALSFLELVGLENHALDFARTLSGGEMQRVCFARALVSRKPFIFADEPTASLDEAATKYIASILRNLKSQSCIIVATHDPLVISACDRVVDLRSQHG
ncbi:MAG: ATP-binding cassette domain-containing protein [Mobiluncus porci]|uniref:ATP-binding cassette domain-containing protein n=1 Tax=Mobiluncus porci TaxID=2652278 RepID=UPI0023F4D78E|nr:ATP-binding cassette domain-containing protein [Mobiluncus porci]MDD7542563.1 ATP-binding cassette domain-containing protein [Mobiluncus porci]MDY5747915.1 ATP-binding cassette domain-containing protein [Mobiluncus porci]